MWCLLSPREFFQLNEDRRFAMAIPVPSLRTFMSRTAHRYLNSALRLPGVRSKNKFDAQPAEPIEGETLGPVNDAPQVASNDSPEVLEPSTQSPVQDDTIDSTEGDGDSDEKPTPEDQGSTEDNSPTSLADILANPLPPELSVDNMLSQTLGNIFQKKVTKDSNLQALLDGRDDVDMRDLATELKEFADEIGATRKSD